MFERYTERARRVIFFARYEASQLDAAAMETEHLLLGLLREEPVLAAMASVDAVRERVKSDTVRGEKSSAAQDLPLGHECKNALVFAAEEGERLRHRDITCLHLALGLLRGKKSRAARLMAEFGITRERLLGAFPGGRPELPREDAVPPLARPLARALLNVQTRLKLSREDASGEARLALGHLIDLATSHHAHWVRGGGDGPLRLPTPEQSAAQRYDEMNAGRLIELWLELQRLLLHVLARMPESGEARAEVVAYAEMVEAWAARWLPDDDA